MDSHEFDTWAAKHAAVFGLQTDADVAMLGSWFELMAGQEFAADELHEATVWLATRPEGPPRYRNQHLEALQARVRDRRRLAEPRRRPAGQPANCALCGGDGLVTVPHPAHVRDGQWVPSGSAWYTVAVSCRCEAGSLVRKRSLRLYEDGKVPAVALSLERYEQTNPDWGWMLQGRDQVLAEASRRSEEARKIDSTLGPLAAPVDDVVRRAGGFAIDKNGGGAA